jgi:hypothetical protein
MNRLRLLTVLVVALSALPLVTLPGTAHADLLYQFDVHETTSPLIGFQPFSFSFTVPTFVTDGQSPAFTPFTMTAGTHSYTMSDDLASIMAGGPPLIGCFQFDTGRTASSAPGCGGGATDVDGDGQFELDVPGGLPTATGMYTIDPSSTGAFGTGAGLAFPDFGGTLDITSVTSVPEPASLALLSLGIVAVGWRLRKRRGVAF